MSVVLVRFARLETLFLFSESICEAFLGHRAADLRNAKSICFVERATGSLPEGWTPTPHPHPSGARFNEFQDFAIVLQRVLQHART